MKSHRVEAAIEWDGTLMLDGLPFHEGEMVEVIVLSRSDASQNAGRYTKSGGRMVHSGQPSWGRGLPSPPDTRLMRAGCPRPQRENATANNRTRYYPLRGKPFQYISPMEPVSHGEWEAGG